MEKKFVRIEKELHGLIKKKSVDNDSTIEQEVNDAIKSKLIAEGDLIE